MSTKDILEDYKKRIDVYERLLAVETELQLAKEAKDIPAIKKLKEELEAVRQESRAVVAPSITIIPATISSKTGINDIG